MAYRIAGIDVHKRMLAVVIADVAVDGEYQFQRREVSTSPSELRRLSEWLVAEEVEEVVMESTAQYWRPVWATLEQLWTPKRRIQEGAGPMSGKLHLAEAQSNRGPAGRKKDFPDAERLVKRLVAQELTLSFVPDGEQRLWRTVLAGYLVMSRQQILKIDMLRRVENFNANNLAALSDIEHDIVRHFPVFDLLLPLIQS